MARRIRRISVALAVTLVAGVVVLVVVVRPGLRDDVQRVDAAWKPLVQPLTARYVALTGVAGALDTAGAGDRDVTRALKRALSDWELLRVTTDAAGQVRAANDLEGFAARVRATVAGSDKLEADDALGRAITAFDQAKLPAAEVSAYNEAVLGYERGRDGFWRSIVASLDGYDARPTLQLPTP